MPSGEGTFWDRVYELRETGQIPRVWERGHLRDFLEPAFTRNTVTTVPSNGSISMEGDKIGDYVKKGASPKAWRVGPGLYQLIEDPADSPADRAAAKARANSKADELRARSRRI